MKDFKDVKIVHNFYQTSSFFPMPTTLIGTLDENNETSLSNTNSICFQHNHDMLLVSSLSKIRGLKIKNIKTEKEGHLLAVEW